MSIFRFAAAAVFAAFVPAVAGAVTLQGADDISLAPALPSGAGEVTGTTAGAASQSSLSATVATAYNGAPGVWYAFGGTGGAVSLNTNSAATAYDTKLNVFSGPASGATNSGLTGVAGNDDVSNCSLASTSFCSGLSFVSTLGSTYYLLVHGFGAASGSYGLNYAGVGGATSPVPLPAGALGLVTALGLAGLVRAGKRAAA